MAFKGIRQHGITMPTMISDIVPAKSPMPSSLKIVRRRCR